MSLHLLVCVDSSDESRKALKNAIDLASNHDSEARISLVHCVTNDTGFSSQSNGELVYETESVFESGEDILKEFETMIDESADFILENPILFEAENPTQAISDVAEEEDVDYVLLGHRGLEQQSNGALSSFTQNLLRHCDKPVIVTSNQEE